MQAPVHDARTAMMPSAAAPPGYGEASDRLLDLLRRNIGATNRHALVVGGPGSGKTTLVRTVVARTCADADLGERWLPIVMPEELYGVASLGDLWTVALRVLCESTAAGDAVASLREHYDRLVDRRDDARLRILALEELREFARQRGVRLLIALENVETLVGQLPRREDRDLVGAIKHVSEITLLLTASRSLHELAPSTTDGDERLHTMQLGALSTNACRATWESITGKTLAGARVRPMEILSGGNLRLLTALARVSERRPDDDLAEMLARALDDHAPLLKREIEALPPQERRVFATLARLWRPSTSRDVGAACSLDVNTTSAVLKNLVRRGLVTPVGKAGRALFYEVVEPVHGLFIGLRATGPEAARLRAFVRFVEAYYGVGGPLGIAAEDATSGGERRRSERRRSANPTVDGDDADDAVDLVARLLVAPNPATLDLDRLTRMVVHAAGAGRHDTVLSALQASAAAHYLEPVVVALQMLRGDDIRAPREVAAVAGDIIRGVEKCGPERRRLERRRTERRQVPPTSSVPPRPDARPTEAHERRAPQPSEDRGAFVWQ